MNRRGMRTGREEDAALVEAASTGDEVAFAAMTARYRRESQVHCYRMLGSFDESQDLRHLPCRRRWPASDVAFQAARYQARRAVDTAAALKACRAACGKDHRL